MEAETRSGPPKAPDAREIAEPSPAPAPGGPSRWWPWPVLVILAVTAVAGGLRFYHLSAPHAYVFDEVYYAKDGCLDAGFPYRQCKLTSDSEQTFTVHPPLGRWIIAGSEAAFGNRPFGWRFASAVFGTLSVTLTAILAYLLFDSALWAGVAGVLLATENLNFVQSRVSMLDILLTTFVVAGFLFLVLDRRWIDRRTSMPTPHEGHDEPDGTVRPERAPSPVFRPWRLATGLAFGAALATKWSGGPPILGAIVLTLVWEVTRRRRIGLDRPAAEGLRDELFGVFIFLVLIPLGIYLASYGRYFADNGVHLSTWYTIQRGMAEFSIQLRATHPYASRPWSWPLMIRPVSYYYKGGANPPTSSEILGMGNPAIFWGGLVALAWTTAASIRRRDWRGGLITAAVASQYLPWFLAARTAFLFYMTPITPFIVLACVYGLMDLWEARVGETQVRSFAPLSVLLIAVALGMFAFFFPVLTGRTLSYNAWHSRMWFRTWI